ncbi:hypothetical protein M8818_007487 [Zalaria obscura]|uniref:Uncharacterized protein n=1 Tax=Zalaria obscura TaxID=2024903 RepID=A0ACC3S3D5_9PEZI
MHETAFLPDLLLAFGTFKADVLASYALQDRLKSLRRLAGLVYKEAQATRLRLPGLDHPEYKACSSARGYIPEAGPNAVNTLEQSNLQIKVHSNATIRSISFDAASDLDRLATYRAIMSRPD